MQLLENFTELTNVYSILAMRIALAQMNSVLGDIEGNVERHQQFIDQAAAKKCDLVVFPEMSLIGYSPNDWLERPEIFARQEKALSQLHKAKPRGLEWIVGGIARNKKTTGKPLFNAAYVSTQIKKSIHKVLLPQYDVFDEGRFFESGEIQEHVVKIQGKKVLILICEDMWAWEKSFYDNPLKKLKSQKIDVVISINGSPFSVDKDKQRLKVATKTAKHFSCPVVYVNMVGGQDELIFDGGSFVIDKKGKVLSNSATATEDLNIIDLKSLIGGKRKNATSSVEKLHANLVMGLRDFAKKNGFQSLHLGSSGGIDSAVVAALACDAIGPRGVMTIGMPGPFSHAQSLELAKDLAKRLGCGFLNYDINESYESLTQGFAKNIGPQEFGVMHENTQARLRGIILMMYANTHSSLLLSTSNKSEIATGYSTLYGDMCGGLAPLGDLLKRQVYELAEYYNREHELIPQRIIDRAPSAELRPNQKDQDSLPSYDVLDKAVEKIVTNSGPATSETEKWLLKKIAQNEFKRWQAPPILRVTEHAFGRGRRFPITNQFYKK